MTRGDGCFSAGQKAQCHAAQGTLCPTHSQAQYDAVQAQLVRFVNHYFCAHTVCAGTADYTSLQLPYLKTLSTHSMLSQQPEWSKLLQHARMHLACSRTRLHTAMRRSTAMAMRRCRHRQSGRATCACVCLRCGGSQCLAQLPEQHAAPAVLMNHREQSMCIQCVNGALR